MFYFNPNFNQNSSPKLIVGLGNPGKEYKITRHNLGFMVINQLAQKLKIELNQKKFNGLYGQNSEYILLQPQTYMNNSGECIQAFMNYFEIPLDNLLVIYDDITLPLGSFNCRFRSSKGGHNGIKSIIEKLGASNSKFKRLRVGIGYDKNYSLAEWVLQKFSPSETKVVRRTIDLLIQTLLESWING